MNELRPGEEVRVGDVTVHVVRELSTAANAGVYRVATEDGPAYLWRGADEDWREAIAHLEAQADGIDRDILAVDSEAQPARALVSSRFEEVEPFEDGWWRDLDTSDALGGLEDLMEEVAQLHDHGLELRGISRDEIVYDPVTLEMEIAGFSGLRTVGRIDEKVVWRDARLVGELAFESFLGHDYPGGHQMANLLQDRDAMAELGLVQPGLSQLVAGCVSPYGDLAYRNIDEVLLAIEQLRRELAPSTTFRVGSASTVGNYIFRRNNQDSCGHAVHQATAGSDEQLVGFFCVADGIGGIRDGERASHAAVNAACRAFSRAVNYYGITPVASHPNEFARAIAKVTSQYLTLRGEFESQRNRGGTTFTGLLVARGRAGLCHIGDSRAALVRDDSLYHLTRDHTLAEILRDLGESGTHDIETSERTIARFLSTAMEIERDRIDTFRRDLDRGLGSRDEVQQKGLAVEPGDVFVLTSDGAHSGLADDEILDYVDLNRQAPQEAANSMIQSALSRVERDNSTALVIRIQ